MTSLSALEWFRQLLWTAVLSAGPTVLVAVIIGFFVAVLQAATQVSDQTVAFAPKALAVVAALVLSGPFMLSQLVQFTSAIFSAIARL
jgi:flagellar biosynthetic protein FliQ